MSSLFLPATQVFSQVHFSWLNSRLVTLNQSWMQPSQAIFQAGAHAHTHTMRFRCCTQQICNSSHCGSLSCRKESKREGERISGINTSCGSRPAASAAKERSCVGHTTSLFNATSRWRGANLWKWMSLACWRWRAMRLWNKMTWPFEESWQKLPLKRRMSF